jgi:hypothetical protein
VRVVVVYFIKSETTGLVKIGTTRCLTLRLTAIRGTTKERLRLLGVVPGGRSVESSLHYRFSSYRRKGEWFALVSEIEEFIASQSIAWDGTDEVEAGVCVKIDAKAAVVARKAASLKEKTLAEYLSDVVLAAASRDLMTESKRIAKGDTSKE